MSRLISAKEFKVICLRDCPLPDDLEVCDSPELAAAYFRSAIMGNPYFDPERESMFVLLLNVRRRVKGHLLVATGTQDSLLAHAREVFRGAIVAAASAIILAHNHPSGDPTPSEADIAVTRDLIQAGRVLGIKVLDHIILAGQKHCSLRELGHFY